MTAIHLCCAGLSQHVIASNISLLRATEVEEVIEGGEDKYKAVSVRTGVSNDGDVSGSKQ